MAQYEHLHTVNPVLLLILLQNPFIQQPNDLTSHAALTAAERSNAGFTMKHPLRRSETERCFIWNVLEWLMKLPVRLEAMERDFQILDCGLAGPCYRLLQVWTVSGVRVRAPSPIEGHAAVSKSSPSDVGGVRLDVKGPSAFAKKGHR